MHFFLIEKKIKGKKVLRAGLGVLSRLKQSVIKDWRENRKERHASVLVIRPITEGGLLRYPCQKFPAAPVS